MNFSVKLEGSRPIQIVSAVAVTVAWAAALQVAPSISSQLSNVGLLLVVSGASLAWFRAARQGGPRRRAKWRLVGAACASWAAGQFAWTVQENVLHIKPFPSLADVGYVGFAFFICASILRPDDHTAVSVGRIRAVLDGLMVALSTFLMSWALILRSVVDGSPESTFATAISIFYPVSDVVIVTLILYAALRYRQLGQRVPPVLRFAAVALVAFSAADSGFAYLTSKGAYHAGSAIDLGWFSAFVTLMLAGVHANSANATAQPSVKNSRPLAQYVPHIAIGAALLVTVLDAREHNLGAFVLTIWAVVVLTLMVRQVLALGENDSLNRELESRVQERTAQLRESERRFRHLVQRSSDVVTVIDARGIVTYQSDSIESIFGYRPEELVATAFTDLLPHGPALQLMGEIERSSVDDGRPRIIELELRHASGQPRVAEFTITNLLADSAVRGVVLNTRDVTERRSLEARLVHDAFHDALTGLPNRSLFNDRLGHALRRTRQASAVAVLFVDLDGFKRVNDSTGHSTGDQLLVEVAARLESCVRPGDTVARFGGDEFAILVEDAGEFGGVSAAERIGAAVKGSVRIGDHEVYLQCSVGVAIAEEDDTEERLLRNADLAMYRAKAVGVGSFALYDPAMHETLVERVNLEADLRRAIDHGELINHYQPTFDLTSGRLSGFEALVRWQHPTRGLLHPGVFIPLAEETGLIRDIGRHVLEDACAHVASWTRTYPELASLSMSINVSGIELRDPALHDEIGACLRSYGVPASTFVFEITESTLIDHTDATIQSLQRLKALGARLAIDDFGTGYSSLSSLHRFPVDILKIDRSFVERILESSDTEFARTIVRLGETLSLTTVAEGIESVEQLDLLRDAGCHVGQGFLYSKPVAADHITSALAGWIAHGQDAELTVR